MRIRHLLVGTALIVGSAVLASPAFADPTGSKNAFQINGMCSGNRTVQVVVNSANGKGQGAQNNTANQAEFAPAHVIGTNEVFHPTAFDVTFTFTPVVARPSRSPTPTPGQTRPAA